MITEILTVTGGLFWLIVAALILLDAIMLGKDNQAGALAVTGIAIVVAALFTDAFRHVSLWWLVILIPLYFAIGVTYAWFKWLAHIRAKKAEAAKEFATKSAGNSSETFASWSEYRRPKASDNKERITGWIGLWPWSMAWVALKFPRRVVVAIYERITTAFERASARLWAD